MVPAFAILADIALFHVWRIQMGTISVADNKDAVFYAGTYY